MRIRDVQSRGFFSKEAGLKKAGCPLFFGKLPQKRSRQSAGLRHALEMLSVLLLAPAPQLPATDPAVQRLQTLQHAVACICWTEDELEV